MQAERRLHPRACVDLPIELINCMGQSAQGSILNLSEEGLSVQGNGVLAGLHQALAGVELELSLIFRVQGELIRCDARVGYRRRLSQQHYQLGLSFTWLDDFSRRLLRSEVEHYLYALEHEPLTDELACIW